MKYPSGKTLTNVYGTSGSNDDLWGRLTEIKDGATSLVQYAHNGVGTPIKTTLPQPGLALDYTLSGALDNFNRIADHAWKKSAADVVRIQHGYDRVGNRNWRNDVVSATNSEHYTYDGVNQIKSLNRGTLNAGKTGVTSPNFTESWNFDNTGNWSQYNRAGTIENRTHNKANEVATIGGSSANVAVDRNGNMTKMPGIASAIYDAWNRLVQIGTTRYDYNGLNQRVRKTVGGVTTTSFYNSNWQELESQEPGALASGLTVFIWGKRYIDDLVCRDKGEVRHYALADPNWNVVALTNTSGTVVERMKYDGFGKITWMNAAFITIANSAYTWNRTFTGQVLDTETGLMLYRNRYYHTGLGRFVTRDPIGYRAGDVSLYRYVRNASLFFADPFGLWKTGKRPKPIVPIPNIPVLRIPKRHGDLTEESLDKLWENLDCDCKKKILDLLNKAGNSQDFGNMGDRRRHYIWPQSRSREERTNDDYTNYIAEELKEFEKAIEAGDVCNAIKILGRLMHTWQDFYGHAPILHPGDIGNPDEIGDGVLPITPWEHGPFEPTFRSPDQARERENAAIDFVLKKLESMMPDILKFGCEAIEECK
jgi:RHS repeat-associated protein